MDNEDPENGNYQSSTGKETDHDSNSIANDTVLNQVNNGVIAGQEHKYELYPTGFGMIASPAADNISHLLSKKKMEYKLKKKELHSTINEPGAEMDEDSMPVLGFGPYQPNYAVPKPEFESNLRKATQYLLQTYVNCNSEYSFPEINSPRRALTKHLEPSGVFPGDNKDGDYILYVNDIIGTKEGHQYQIIDSLGCGTFGQVVKCRNIKTRQVIALKVIKNKPAYYNQALVEVAILDLLNKKFDPNGKHHIVRMNDSFVFKNHLCIAFELLSVNLYELIKTNNHRGLSTNLIRMFVIQILNALKVLSKARLIHCDLKPENILLKTLESPSITIIDFGSACQENQTVYSYIQSRFYRAPEILLGLPYNCSIDMWSLGCIAAELFLGLPLFPGSSEYNQISRIVELLGMPPNYMCEQGKNGSLYFDKSESPTGRPVYTLKSMEDYARIRKVTEQPSKRYFTGNTLSEIIHGYPIMRKGMSSREIELEMQNRRSFVDFLSGLLRYNPLQRWTPQQALLHPFITQKAFLGPFNPLDVPVINTNAPFDTHPNLTSPMKPKTHRQFTDPYLDQSLSLFANQETNFLSDYSYQTVVGHFSGFQINPDTMPFSLAGPGGPGPSSLTTKGGAFPFRKAKSQFNVTETTFGSLPQHQITSFQSTPEMSQESHHHPYNIEIHPRHGDFGERARIPSRLPSVANSVDWEIFKDYDGNSYAGSRAGSFSTNYLGSRNNSYHDLSPAGEAARRSSLNYSNSPKQRHLGFHRLPPGSFSNDPYVNESDYYYRNSFSGQVNHMNGAYASQQATRSGHKKQRSISSLPIQSSPDIRSGRRPSVPNSVFSSSSQKSSKPSLYSESFPSERRNSFMDAGSELQNPLFSDTEDEQPVEETRSTKTNTKPINLPGYEYMEPGND